MSVRDSEVSFDEANGRISVNHGEIDVKESIGQFIEQRKTQGLSRSNDSHFQGEALLASQEIRATRATYRTTFSGEHGLTTFTGILALLSTILGGGIVGLPQACYNLGLPFALTLSAVMIVVTYGSGKLYLRIKDILPDQPESLYEIGYMCYGNLAIYAVASIQLINSFILMILYFVVFSDTTAGLVASLTNHTKGDTFFCDKWFYVLILASMLTPIVLKKELAELEWLSVILFASIFLFLLCILLLLVATPKFPGMPEDSDLINPKSGWQILSGFAPFLVAYSYQQNLFPIYGSLKVKTNENYIRTSNLGLMASFVIYTLTGVLCLLCYGSDIKSDVLDNVGLTYNVGTHEFWECYVIQVSFMVVLICHIPFIFFAGKEGLLIIIDEIMRKSISSALWHKMQVSAPNFQDKYGESQPSNIDLPIPGDPSRQSYAVLARLTASQSPEEQRSTVAQVMRRTTKVLEEKTQEQANRLAYKDMKTLYYVLATLTLYALIVCMALAIDDVDLVLNFASAISITALAFIFPGVYLLKAASKFPTNAQKFADSMGTYRAFCFVYLVLGFCNFCIAMTSAIKYVIDTYG